MRESALTKKVLEYLNSVPGCKAIKIHGNAYVETGTPDIAGCIRGRAFFLELKVPGEKPTILQQKRIKEWQEAGAISGWATSLEEVIELLKDVL